MSIGRALPLPVVALAVSALLGCAATGDAQTTRTTRTTTTLPQPVGGDGLPPALGTELPDPGIAPGECETITYTPPTAPDEQEGRLCAPEVSRHDVAVLLLHGGGGTSGDHRGMSAWEQAYLDAGIATFAVDYELFDPGDDGPVFPGPEQDVKAAVQYLRGTAAWVGADPERIVVQGFSAGARLGAVAHTTGNDTWFDGRRAWEGIGDHVDGFIGLYGTYDGYVNHDAVYYGGGEDDSDPDVVARRAHADAIANADGAAGPTLLFVGEDDWTDLTTQMLAFSRALHRAGRDADTNVVADADHGYDLAAGGLTEQGEETFFEILLWLDEHFPVD